jgi:hypothetical protein
MSKLTRTPQPKLAESDRREKMPSKSSGVDKGASPLAQSNTRTHGKDVHGDHKEKMEAHEKSSVKMDKANGPDKEATHKGPFREIALDQSESKVDGHNQLALNAQARRDDQLDKERGHCQLHDATKHIKPDCPMND